MRILNNIGLSFDDVLLIPQKSSISSRFSGEIDLSVELIPNIKFKYALIASNMDTISEYQLANAMTDLGALAIIHRFMKTEEQVKQLKQLWGPKILCIGVGKEEFARFEYTSKLVDLDAVLIDIAHGHSDVMLKQVSRIKKVSNVPIIAGSVATYQGTMDLLNAGVSSIKLGVGNGCLGPDTRILMADGTYKNIVDIKIHDKVINMKGVPVDVIGVRFSGIKKVKKYRSNLFYKNTFSTGDHLHYVGDYSSTPKVLESGGLNKTLDKLTYSGETKYKWKSIEELKEQVCLLPNKIDFRIPETFTLDLKEVSLSNRNWKGFIEYDLIRPSYDLGYIFGMFLGDGTASLKHYKRKNKKTGENGRNLNGTLHWDFGLEEGEIAEKLKDCLNSVFGKFSNTSIKEKESILRVFNRSNVVVRLFVPFGKKQNKSLPEQYRCMDKKYLEGLLDGLVDSDGTSPRKGGKDPREGFYNTSIYLIELFMWAFYMVEGYFPSIQYVKPTAGGLKNCNVENCSPSYVVRSVGHPEWNQTNNYQINRIYTEIEDVEIEIPTYDIEVDCKTHSFIANNVIVHNSLCSTRIQTGCGVPQITALIEGRQAIEDFYIKNPTGFKPTLICDGGVKNGGDIIKAFAVGADAIISGSLFAGTEETPTEKIMTKNGLMKKYRGMASFDFQKSWKGFATSVEGEMKYTPYKGFVADVFKDLIAGILSGMSYQNARNIKELRDNAELIQITSAGYKESLPHGLL